MKRTANQDWESPSHEASQIVQESSLSSSPESAAVEQPKRSARLKSKRVQEHTVRRATRFVRLREEATTLLRDAEQKRAFNMLFSEISAGDRDQVEYCVQRYYPMVLEKDMLDDPWPLQLDEHGTLRWKEDKMVSHLVGSHIDGLVPGDHMNPARARHVNDICPLNLNKLALTLHHGYYEIHNYRKLMKRIGYSLKGYYQLSDIWPKEEEEEDEDKEIVVL